jgi:hypothetical protein
MIFPFLGQVTRLLSWPSEVVLQGLIHVKTTHRRWLVWEKAGTSTAGFSGRGARARLVTAEALDLNAEFLDLIVEGQLWHFQQLQGFVDPAIGPPQGKTDEEAFDLFQDLMPGGFLVGTPQEVL